MKKAELGDYLLWNGKLAQIKWTCDSPTVGVVILEPNKCPHCGGILDNERLDVIPGSPLFQELAEPIKTIKNE